MNWSSSAIFLGGEQFVLGLIFAISTIAKVRNPSLWTDSVANYRLTDMRWLNRSMVIAVPVMEASLATGLVAQVWPVAFLAGSALLTSVFALVQLVTLQRSIDANCGCFGTETKVSRMTATRAGVLAIISTGAVVTAVARDGLSPVGIPPWQEIAQGALAGCAVLAAIFVFRSSIHAISQAIVLKRMVSN